ncbi:MAG: hypothetical protein PHW82_07410 [Bacteroidales bacterium]|nr:hypothetical protein [Bacteroidales bacterium]
MKTLIITTFVLTCYAMTVCAQDIPNITQDSVVNITTIGVFDGQKYIVDNFERKKVYKINEYYISLADVSESQVDSLKGKKVRVTGKLKFVKGKVWPAKTSDDDKIYEPYREPDKKFISEPSYTIVN